LLKPVDPEQVADAILNVLRDETRGTCERAQKVRQEAQKTAKESQQLRDIADVLAP
jgi:DNA-binding NarL/FixJ family response regulator